MKAHRFLVNILILIAFCACTVSTDYTSALKHAEDCMNDQPENALTALQNIPYPEQLSNQQYALWCLLITQAQDKCYITHDTDSLINIAVRYFDKGDNSYRKAQAYYCQGRVYTDMLLFDKAIVSYLKAEEFLQEGTDYKLYASISNQLGDLYRKNTLYEKSLPCYKKANFYYKLVGYLKGEAFTLRDIGIVYECLGQLDSSVYYLNQSLELAKEKGWIGLNISVLKCLGSTYTSMSLYPIAIDYINQALNVGHGTSNLYSSYLSLAQLYNKMGQRDSALFYLNKVMHSSDINLRCQSYRELSILSFQKNDYRSTVEYNERYLILRDSVEHIFQSQKLAEVEALYNFEKLTNDKNRLLLLKKNNEIIFLLVFVILLIIFFILVYVYNHKIRMKQLELEIKDQILILNEQKLHEYQLEITKNKATLAEKDNELQLKIEEFQRIFSINKELEKEKLQLEKSYSQKTGALNKEVNILRSEINEKKVSLTKKDNELQLKLEEYQMHIAKIQTLENNNQKIEDEYSRKTEKLSQEIAILHEDVEKHKIMLAQKEGELHLKIEEFQNVCVKIQMLECDMHELEKSYIIKTEILNKEICTLQEDVKCQKDSVKKSERKFNEFAKRFLVNDSKQMMQLYDKKVAITAYTNKEWESFYNSFILVYPDFIDKLQKTIPDLHLNMQRYCCMFILGIKTSKISAALGLQPNTVSKYREAIENKYSEIHGDKSFEAIMSNLV